MLVPMQVGLVLLTWLEENHMERFGHMVVCRNAGYHPDVILSEATISWLTTGSDTD